MSEELLVRHCAPTLAGLKTGNMFTCPYVSREEVQRGIRALNKALAGKGLCVMPLRYLRERVLIYVFRPRRLGRDLAAEQARGLLRDRGYEWRAPAQCLRQLMRRLDEDGEFPHEIGLFLGYPPEDVAGFIENAACGYKCVGCWKVYGDEDEAKKTFDKYKKCSRVYYNKWREGMSIDRLTVAC